MKRVMAILFLLLATCVAPVHETAPSETSAMATAPEPPKVIWEKSLDNNGRADLAWEIVETPDGDLVLVGATGPTPCQLGCNWDGWVVKLNAQGNLLWARQFGGNGADLLTAIILKGNDYVVVGSKYVFPYARQAWLLRLAPDGNPVWEKTLGGDRDDSGADIIATSDGGFLMLGQTQSFGVQDGKSDMWLVKLDSSGGTVWTKTYDLGAEDMGVSLAPFQKDRFIIAAVSCTANCGGLLQQGQASYFVVDSAGNILKSVTFAEGPKNKFLKVKPTSDGGAVLVGATSITENFPSEDTWVVKLNGEADLVWTTVLSSSGRYDGGHDIIETPDGGYVVAAYSQAYQTPQMNYDNFWMVRLNRNGDVQWAQMWGGPDNDDLCSVILTSDGGVVLAGFKDAVSWPLTAIPGPADFYVVKPILVDYNVFLPCVFKNQ